MDVRALEPEAQGFLQLDQLCMASIAISLKRIADAICGDDQNTGIHRAIVDIANPGRSA